MVLKQYDVSITCKTKAKVSLGFNTYSMIFFLQGKADNFLPAGQLLPDNFVTACAEAKMELVMRMQEVQQCGCVCVCGCRVCVLMSAVIPEHCQTYL